MFSLIRRAFVCALLASVVAVPGALAAPVTVNLRVEGSTQTLFEGPVSTDARTIVTPSDPAPGHPCSVHDNGPSAPNGPVAGTPTTALYDAAGAAGLAFDAEWFGSTPFGTINDYFVSQVGTDVNQKLGAVRLVGAGRRLHLQLDRRLPGRRHPGDGRPVGL